MVVDKERMRKLLSGVTFREAQQVAQVDITPKAGLDWNSPKKGSWLSCLLWMAYGGDQRCGTGQLPAKVDQKVLRRRLEHAFLNKKYATEENPLPLCIRLQLGLVSAYGQTPEALREAFGTDDAVQAVRVQASLTPTDVEAIMSKLPEAERSAALGEFREQAKVLEVKAQKVEKLTKALQTKLPSYLTNLIKKAKQQQRGV